MNRQERRAASQKISKTDWNLQISPVNLETYWCRVVFYRSEKWKWEFLPLMWHETGDIYICRIVPYVESGAKRSRVRLARCAENIGTVVNYLRLVLAYKVNTEDHDAPLEYSHSIKMPCNHSKFTIKYDEVSKKYYSTFHRIKEFRKLSSEQGW